MAHSPFDKSTVYHSALVKETQDNGALQIKILCDGPEESKFKGREPQIAFQCYGDTHYYQIENEACGEALSGLKGQTVEIVASGRDDKAHIEVSDGERSNRGGGRGRSSGRDEERGGGRQDRQQSQRREEEPPARKTKEEKEADERRAFLAAKVYAAKCGVLMDICLHIATGLAEKHLTDTGDAINNEDVRSMATTLFIETKSTTDLHKLPVKFLDKGAPPQQERPPERQPDPEPRREEPPPARRRPEPDPADDAEIDDIPF